MILDASIQGTEVQLLNTRAASRRKAEKVLVSAFDRSKGAFLARLALYKGKPSSPAMKLLMDVAVRFMENLAVHAVRQSLDPASGQLQKLDTSRAQKIGEDLDDGSHSRFLYPQHLQWMYRDFVRETQRFASRSAGSLVRLLRREKRFIMDSQLYFLLTDNPNDETCPFAFMAAVPLQRAGRWRWIPLDQAARKLPFWKGGHQLATALNTAVSHSPLIRRLVQTRMILHPMRLSAEEGLQLIQEVPAFEQAGIVCMLPSWLDDKSTKLAFDWEPTSGMMNARTLLEYVPEMLYHGQPITEEEAKTLLERNEGVQKINGRWVDSSHDALRALLSGYQNARKDGQSLSALFALQEQGFEQEEAPELDISYEDWITWRCRLNHEVHPSPLPCAFETVLRPYQKQAFAWLDRMEQHKLGVILADDMGLGKTVEILALLESLRNSGKNRILAVVPATLVGNWAAEIRKFAPWMSFAILEGKNEPEAGTTEAFLTLVTYQKCRRSAYVQSVHWDCIILDEAQAIKNPSAAQTLKVKELKGDFRVALTGTPIENNLQELWSIFDFINPGLLGTRQQFGYFRHNEEGLDKLKKVISPFVMRRMKTDKSIVPDLPEKNEIDVRISLSKEQVVLYRKEVEKLEEVLRDEDPARKKFVILAEIMKLKQICNHPAQFLKTEDYSLSRSGKFEALRDIAETIRENGEKVIVFTQFAQIIPALNDLLAKTFHKEGAVIDGSTPVAKRMKIVDAFQGEDLPFLVLSLKTAGVGLNLTAAHNVIHFDRWWNPAAENQATDRAYRIGQRNDVTVYRFVSADTIEEAISSMLGRKQDLADQVINDLDSESLTQLSADELMQAIRWRG